MTLLQSLRRCALVAALAIGGPAAAAECPPSAALPSAEQMHAAMNAARDRGFLWRIRKSGRTSYLYGTIHLGRFEWAFPGPTVARALGETDTLALEVDLTDPAVARQATAAGGGNLVLPAPLRARLERQFAAACVPSAALAAMHPLMQAISLTVLAGRWDGLDPAFAQEITLAGFARAAQRPVVSLETIGAQLALLLPRDPKTALVMVERSLDALEAGRVRPMLKRMAGAWDNGDLAELENYERWCDCTGTDEERTLLKRLNDERNPNLADGIDRLHAQGKTVFAAVGALHMTGPKALPLLLAQRGYAVERVAFAR